MKLAVNIKVNLTFDERSLLAFAFKKVVQIRRQSWKTAKTEDDMIAVQQIGKELLEISHDVSVSCSYLTYPSLTFFTFKLPSLPNLL
jgi:hypothetical protein